MAFPFLDLPIVLQAQIIREYFAEWEVEFVNNKRFISDSDSSNSERSDEEEEEEEPLSSDEDEEQAKEKSPEKSPERIIYDDDEPEAESEVGSYTWGSDSEFDHNSDIEVEVENSIQAAWKASKRQLERGISITGKPPVALLRTCKAIFKMAVPIRKSSYPNTMITDSFETVTNAPFFNWAWRDIHTISIDMDQYEQPYERPDFTLEIFPSLTTIKINAQMQCGGDAAYLDRGFHEAGTKGKNRFMAGDNDEAIVNKYEHIILKAAPRYTPETAVKLLRLHFEVQLGLYATESRDSLKLGLFRQERAAWMVIHYTCPNGEDLEFKVLARALTNGEKWKARVYDPKYRSKYTKYMGPCDVYKMPQIFPKPLRWVNAFVLDRASDQTREAWKNYVYKLAAQGADFASMPPDPRDPEDDWIDWYKNRHNKENC